MSALLLEFADSGGDSTYPLSFSALGLTGVGGFIYDGKWSQFYTDSAMTVPCTNSGSDPVGAISDVSGNDNHATRSVSANKPVFYSAGGIKSAMGGTISGVDRSLAVPALGAVTNLTVYYVGKLAGATTSGLAVILPQNGGGHFYADYNGAPSGRWNGFVPSGESSQFDGSVLNGDAGITKWDWNVTSAGLATYKGTTDMASGYNVLIAERAWPGSADLLAGQILGFIGAAINTMESPFIFVAATSIADGSDVDTAILAYIRSNFGSW